MICDRLIYIDYINDYIENNKYIKSTQVAKRFLDKQPSKIKLKQTNEIDKEILSLITVARLYLTKLYNKKELTLYRSGVPRVYIKKKQRLTNRINSNLNDLEYKKLKEIAFNLNLTISQFVRFCINNYIEQIST